MARTLKSNIAFEVKKSSCSALEDSRRAHEVAPVWLALLRIAVFSKPEALSCAFPLLLASSTLALISFICAFRSTSCAFSMAFLASLYSLIRFLPSEPCRRLSSAFRRSGSWIMAENVSNTFLIGMLWRSATSAKGKRSWHVSAISTTL